MTAPRPGENNDSGRRGPASELPWRCLTGGGCLPHAVGLG